MDLLFLILSLVLMLCFLVIGVSRRAMWWPFIGGMIGLIAFVKLVQDGYSLSCAFCGVSSTMSLDPLSSMILLLPTIFCFMAMISISRWGA